jgi:hypothetical protein
MLSRMLSDLAAAPRLLALSDLHVGYPENPAIVRQTRPAADLPQPLTAGVFR